MTSASGISPTIHHRGSAVSEKEDTDAYPPSVSSLSTLESGPTTRPKPSHDETHRKLKSRHIQLIGIGGTIGTALYVQIGRGLMQGGPASLFIAFTFW